MKLNGKMKEDEFKYVVEDFADLQILRYRVHGFEQLSLRQKKLVFYLSQAALEGRDILFDQNGEYNLRIRKLFESIYLHYKGNRDTAEFQQIVIYLKRLWFSNGIYHHYSCDKFVPGFSENYLKSVLESLDVSLVASGKEETLEKVCDELFPVIFNPDILPKRVNQVDGEDLIQTSAANYYKGLTQQEAVDFYDKKKKGNDPEPVMYGMNSRLVKENGQIYEQIWRVGGMYSAAIEKIVGWLEKAIDVAENDGQCEIIRLLIDFYRTGNLHVFDEYSIAWLKDTSSHVDFVNGFIESYGDPLGMKASWESIVDFKDVEATRRTEVISANAQWFEDHSPVDKRFKKEQVKGVSAKVITAAMLGGDLYPSSAIGINLPNSNWIRSVHGSKSVTIGNLTETYNRAARGNGFREEFVYSKVELDLLNRYADITDDLHTDLHECLGHGSGRLLPGVDPDALKSYGSAIEEARADLFGLYYLPDRKLIELGLLPDSDAYKAEYYAYMMNGLMTQLARIELGRTLEEAHMRNRQLIARWALKHGEQERVVEMVRCNDKTYVRINDYEALRKLFGKLLSEIQRIKSEGDYEAARMLIEQYAVQIDPILHAEVLERYRRLHLSPYKGFINPLYTPVCGENGEITDVQVSYTEGYAEQMLRYSRDFANL